MATDTATTQNDTKPAEAPKAETPATPAASTQAKSTSKPRAKTAKKPRAKTAAKSRTRTRSTASSSSRSRTASKSRTRKPAARTTRKPAARTTRSAAAKTAAATTSAPRAETKALTGGQQFVAGVIDAQERTVTALVDYQTRAAEASQIPGATAIASAQAQVLRGVTDAYLSAARAFLR
jgi:hypothetical protein